MPSDCIFCKILKKRDEPILYEDDLCFVILSIKPITKGHTLIIPKDHVDSYLNVPEVVALHMMTIARTLAPRIMEGVESSACHISINVGAASNRSVPHAHMHIIPRKKGDGLKGWQGERVSLDQTKDLAEHLRKYL